MMRRIRFLLVIALAAIAGAIVGRVAAEVRRKQEAGEPIELSISDVKIRVQDVVPGLVAAARVRDTPWSWLHIPSWLAAFGVNLGVGAVGGDLSRIREMAERAAFGIAGFEIPRDEDDFADAYEVVAEEADPAPQPPTTSSSSTPSPSSPPFAAASEGGSVTWTAPGPAERRADAPTGFTAFGE
ncbi:MAG: hypothetical protein WC273_03935 [Dehalococcoidia bacterium]